MRVVTERMPHLESAAIGVWVDAGARNETVANNGIAHMLEHMAFKGTERRSARDIAEEIEAVGGHLNAYTSRENTAYFVRVLKEDVPLGIDILADILQHSVFDEEELERERAVIIQEIGQTEDTPDDIIFDHLQETAYPDQPMGRSILGTVERVAGMGRDALAGFMATHYCAPRMVLVATGAVDHAAVLRLAESSFIELPKTDIGKPEPATYRGGDFRENKELEQVHFVLAMPGIAYKDPDFYAAQVMSTVLGGGMSSRLFQEVRENRGLCYSVFSFATSFIDGGMLGIYAGTGAAELRELVPVICDEFEKLVEAVDEAEVARARAQLKAGMLMSMESPSARAEQIGRQLLIYGRPLTVEEIVEKVEAVDTSAVCGIARRFAQAGKPTVATLGPIGALASFDEIAARFG